MLFYLLLRLSMEKISNFILPAKTFKNEAEFTTWFWWQIRKNGGFFHKISDESRGLKPFDSLLAYRWYVAAVEIKFVRSASCYPFWLLRWSSPSKPWAQVEWLRDFQINGWNSIMVVYSATKHAYIVVDFARLDLSTKVHFPCSEETLHKTSTNQ